MNIQHPHLKLARIVLEAVSPLSVASGRASLRFDTAIARDANGLPVIPGTSLAGVLKHLHADGGGDEKALFGHARQRGADNATDQPSRVSVSWGCVLDSQGRAVEGLLAGEHAARAGDPLLALLADEAPVARRRVRLNHKGAADAEGRGLFDRSAVPRGTRFAFEIMLQADDAGRLESEWQRLRQLFAHPALRLGGATRAGMGEVRCVRWHEAGFDLTQAGDYARFAALGRGVDEIEGLDERPLSEDGAATGWRRIRVRLEPVAGWRIGGMAGAPLNRHGDKEPDDVPHHEPVIVWDGGWAKIRRGRAVAPASAVKGALAHRVAFHANRLAGRWGKDAPVGEDCPEVVELFGKAAGGEGAHAGRVLISDAWLSDEPTTLWQMHTSIDRFTGGVREGALFGEEVLWREKLNLEIWLREDVGETAVNALEMALEDLTEGRLPLGADAARGHGLMRGAWEDAND